MAYKNISSQVENICIFFSEKIMIFDNKLIFSAICNSYIPEEFHVCKLCETSKISSV